MNEDQLDIRVPGEHANISEVPYLVDYHRLRLRRTSSHVCAFSFVSLVPLNYCILMHYSNPLVFLEILYNPIHQFLNKFLLVITVGSGSVRSQLVNIGHENKLHLIAIYVSHIGFK